MGKSSEKQPPLDKLELTAAKDSNFVRPNLSSREYAAAVKRNKSLYGGNSAHHTPPLRAQPKPPVDKDNNNDNVSDSPHHKWVNPDVMDFDQFQAHDVATENLRRDALLDNCLLTISQFGLREPPIDQVGFVNYTMGLTSFTGKIQRFIPESMKHNGAFPFNHRHDPNFMLKKTNKRDHSDEDDRPSKIGKPKTTEDERKKVGKILRRFTFDPPQMEHAFKKIWTRQFLNNPVLANGVFAIEPEIVINAPNSKDIDWRFPNDDTKWHIETMIFRSFKREEYELLRKFNKSELGYIWHHTRIHGQGKSRDTDLTMNNAEASTSATRIENNDQS